MSVSSFMFFIVLTLVVCLGVYSLITGQIKPKSLGGKSESDSAMYASLLRGAKRFAGVAGFEVVEKATLNFGGQSYTFDAILLGFFGTIAIKADYNTGDIYGDLRDEKWCCVDGDDKKSYFANPLPAIGGSPKFFKEMYAAEKVKCGMTDSFVVFPGKKAKLFTSKRVDAYTLETMGEKLRSEKYSKDNGADISAMKSAIEKHSV